MHIAIYSPSWPPGNLPNGIVTYVKWISGELRLQGHQVSIVAGKLDLDSTEIDAHVVRKKWGTKTIDTAKSKIFGIRETVFDYDKQIAETILAIHKKNPIDIIEMEESFGWVSGVKRRTRIPVVCKLHGPAFLHLVEEELKTPFGMEKVKKEGEALASLDIIISPSDHHLRKTLEKYNLKPSFAKRVNNPIGQNKSLPLWNSDYAEKNTILFVGRFDKIKGGDIVINAFHTLLRTRPDLKLIFAGPDPGLIISTGEKIGICDFIKSFNDPLLTAGIQYLGKRLPSEIVVLRTQAMVTIVASRLENQNYTALEVMLQGCPLVCTDTTGMAEIVEHEVTGLKSHSDDHIDMARQIARLLDDSLLGKTLGLAARKYVQDNHSPGFVAAETIAAYDAAMRQVQ